MIKIDTDVDIDLADRDQLLKLLKHVPASISKNEQLTRHNTGVYFTDVPTDTVKGICSLDYKEAEERGYFKLDFLNVSVYQSVTSREHLDQLLNTTPPWHRLWTDPEFTSRIIHIGNYYQLLQQMKPDSITRMAMFLAVIRPGKKHLIGKSWKEIAETVWIKPEDDSYFFKKAHSVGYAHLVQVHMNLLNAAN